MSADNFYEEYWEKGRSWSPSGGGIHPVQAYLFKKYASPGAKLLDYGCGDGKRYGAFLQSSGVEYTGFDISKEAVNTAKESGVNIRLLDENGLTDVEDSSQDVVTCFEVLEHLMRPDFALDEISRVLKPEGIALISVPNAGHWSSRLEFLLTGFFNPGGSPLTSRKAPWKDAHIRFFSVKIIKKLIRSRGFSCQRLIPVKFTLGDAPYLYKRNALGRLADTLSLPFGWTSRLMPGLLSSRTFVVAKCEKVK